MSANLDSGRSPDEVPETGQSSSGEYVVVARRYRPQTFEDLVGQQQVSKALSNAITTSRVGHAYLFTGARGVGKTSTARILAKCLNCTQGPTPAPCGVCDNCVCITSGDDVDVLEIDGASNRGIDEIRQLRSNVNVRPSRSHFKIYIIDEVHMLTVAAFNALLKTLEEPPEHVKFIFCTTDPEKIPITVLSRCQRFDFPPIGTDSIVARLQDIVRSEGAQAEDAAIRLLARRAAGSMRDSQSLLEQLLAFSGSTLTEADVHAMLGTAAGGRLLAIAQHLIGRDSAAALGELDAAVREGVDVGQLAEQLLGYFRDMMAAQVGCAAELMIYAAAADHAVLKEAGDRWGLETLLAAVQILDQSLVRMRQSTQVRTLVEIALVRICNLADLDSLPALISQLGGGGPASKPPTGIKRPRGSSGGKNPKSTAQKKTKLTPEAPGQASSATAPDSPVSVAPASPGVAKDVEQQWREALDEIGGLTAECAGNYESVAISAPNLLVVQLKTAYNKEWCDRSDVKQRLERAMSRVAGRKIRIDFSAALERKPGPAEQRPAPPSRLQRIRQVEQHPLVQETVRLFDAEIVRVDERRTK